MRLMVCTLTLRYFALQSLHCSRPAGGVLFFTQPDAGYWFLEHEVSQ